MNNNIKYVEIKLDDRLSALVKKARKGSSQVLAVAVGARPFINDSGKIITIDQDRITAEQMDGLVGLLPRESKSGSYAYRGDHSHEGWNFCISIGQSEDKVSSAATFIFI